MNRRGFLGLGAALAVAPKAVLSAPSPSLVGFALGADVGYGTCVVTAMDYVTGIITIDWKFRRVEGGSG